MSYAQEGIRRVAERIRRAGAAHPYALNEPRITNGAINAAASNRRSPSLCDLPARGDANAEDPTASYHRPSRVSPIRPRWDARRAEMGGAEMAANSHYSYCEPMQRKQSFSSLASERCSARKNPLTSANPLESMTIT